MERSHIAYVCLATVLGLAAPAAAKEEGGAVVGEILEVLKQRGLVDEAEYQRLAAKNSAWEAERAERDAWLPVIRWSGDFRFRHESFWYDDDATSFDQDDRFRLRYRFRLQGEAEVADWASVIFRFTSGDFDNRSTNQTLGSGVDFDKDDARLDLAYARLRAPSDWVPLPNGKAALELGKVPNPFVWKVGKDIMLWDNDITLEGASLLVTTEPTELVSLFANAGYYIDDENSADKDPHFFAIQTGGSYKAGDEVTLGARGTFYNFRSIDSAFVTRGATGVGASTVTAGNILDGLAGDANGDPFSVLEAAAYLTFSAIERWPLTIYGDWSQNLDAAGSALFPGAGEEDTAWGLGLEVGDKKLVKVGVGYWHIEANAFPSFFIDSDLFDGVTNREGFAVYGSRELFHNTELNLTVFFGDEIEDDLPAFLASVRNAERIRMQADLNFKF